MGARVPVEFVLYRVFYVFGCVCRGFAVGRKVEGFAFGEGGLAFAGVPNGNSDGVVEVAEVLVAEAGAAATEAVGLDVAALEALGLGASGVMVSVSVCMCVGSPYPVFVCKIFNPFELGSYQRMD